MSLFKKQSESEIRAAELIKMYGLKKDPKVQNRYWLDDEQYISIIPADPANVRQVEITLKEFYGKPIIQKATQEQITAKETTKKKGGFGLKLNSDSPFMKGMEEVGNNFMRNAPHMGDDLSGVGQNAMKSGVKNANQMSGMDSGIAQNVAKMNVQTSNLQDMGLKKPDAVTDYLNLGNQKPKKKPIVKRNTRTTKKTPVAKK
jgi:hypothetical protein